MIYVARQLGHDAKLTLSTYGHVIDEFEDAPRVRAIFARHDPIDPAIRGQEYRSGGWERFAPKAEPYRPSPAAIERTMEPAFGRRWCVVAGACSLIDRHAHGVTDPRRTGP